MVDIDDSSAQICPIIQMVQTETRERKRIFRVTWSVHNFNAQTNTYNTHRKEKFFDTEEAARRFNRRRQDAAELLGLQEAANNGYPVSVEVESDTQS